MDQKQYFEQYIGKNKSYKIPRGIKDMDDIWLMPEHPQTNKLRKIDTRYVSLIKLSVFKAIKIAVITIVVLALIGSVSLVIS